MADMPKPTTRRRKAVTAEKSISALARSRSAECIDVLLEIASNGDNAAATRVAAAIALLDRGWGKPGAMAADDDAGQPIFGDISLEQVMAARSRVIDDC